MLSCEMSPLQDQRKVTESYVSVYYTRYASIMTFLIFAVVVVNVMACRRPASNQINHPLNVSGHNVPTVYMFLCVCVCVCLYVRLWLYY